MQTEQEKKKLHRGTSDFAFELFFFHFIHWLTTQELKLEK